MSEITLHTVAAALLDIERKLDFLISCLAVEEEGEEPPALALDGSEKGRERQQGQSLG